MNKGPQPIGGPPAAPHPSPSGISQTAYPSGQTTAPVVFAPQQTPQMNTQPQPRQFAAGPRALHQQQYYPNRAQQQNSASRVQSSATTRPVASATHVYPPGSQTIMMMTQQIPTYQSSGPYYVPSQFRSSFVQPTQQYPVPPGTGFYSNPNPGDYPYGTYYPATQGVQQYSAPVAPATVMINPTQPQMPPKRERKQIRIRDPNQGGKDITEEIMSGGRSGSTPTPPQSAGSLDGGSAVQTNGENPHPVPVVIRPDKPKSPAVATKLLDDLNKAEKSITPDKVESKSEINTKLTDSEEVLETPVTEPDDTTTNVVSCDVTVTDSLPSDHADNEMDPLTEPTSLPPAAKEMQKIETEKVQELQKEEAIAKESSSKDLAVESNGAMAGQEDDPGQEFEVPQPLLEAPRPLFKAHLEAPRPPLVALQPPLDAPRPPLEIPPEAPRPPLEAPLEVPLATPQPPLEAALPPLEAPQPPLEVPLEAPRLPLEVPLEAPQPPLEVPLEAPRPPLEAPRPPQEAPLEAAQPLLEAPQPPLEAQLEALRPPLEAALVAPRPSLEAPLDAPRPSLEAPLEAPRPALEAPRPPIEAPLEAPRPPIEAPLEAPRPPIEAPLEAPRPPIEAPLEAPRPPIEAPLEAPRPPIEAPLEAPRPPIEAPLEAPRPPIEAPLEAPRPPLEAPLEAPRPPLEAPLEAPRPLLEAPLEAPRPPLEAPLEAPRPHHEAPLEAPRPLHEAPLEAPRPPPGAPLEAPQPHLEAPRPPLEAPLEASRPPLEAEIDSPIAQPEELKMTNGLELPTGQDSKVSEAQQESDISPISEPEATKPEASAVVLVPSEKEEEDNLEIQSQDASSTAASLNQTNDNPMQAAAVSVPKKKRKLKDLNKKEAVGDLLDAFKESQVKEPAPETDAQPAAASIEVNEVIPSARDEPEETWEEKEDKQDVENIKPDGIKLLDQKYQYKEENWKPLNPEDKKKYDREFLLGFQFIFASMQKPEGLPAISDVVLDKANKTPLRPLDPSRLTGMNCGPDFTPSYATFPGRQPIGRGPPSGVGTRRSQQGQRKEPRKIIATVSLNDDIQLKKAEHAWKPSVKKPTEDDEPDLIKTQELFRKVRSILNKLTPQMFQQLMKQVAELTIDNEERLKGVIDLVFEKAISEPNFSVAYANMCRCLTTLKVPIPDKPGATVNFRKLLLNRCQKEFEKDKDDDAVIDKKQKEIDAAVMSEEKTRLQEELKDARDKARRRSLGNIKFIGELFKLKMLTEPIMHDCIVKLLKNHDAESLECLCRLLTTIGKDLDFEKAKPRMDQYFNQMEKIIKERKTSSRIRFMVQDVIDLRQNNWVPRRGDQGPKTLEQIHREAQIEEHQQHLRVQQQLLSKQDKRRGAAGSSSTGGRGSQGIDEAGWNTVPIAKSSRPIDTSRLSKITKAGAMDYNNQVLAPAGRLGGWVKGSSGGSGSKPNDTGVDSGRPTTATVNRFSALQQSSSTDNFDARRVVPRSSSSRDRSEKGERDRGDRFERSDRSDRNERSERSDRSEKSDKSDRVEKPERSDRNRPPITKRSYSKEVDDRSRERERRSSQEPVRRVASMTEERDRGHMRDRSKESVKLEPVSASVTSDKPALSEEEFEKKSKAIIEEYLHINDMKEALQCVQELESPKTLHVFVRSGIESTLERSAIAREHMGMLLFQLVKAGTLSKEQYCKGLHEILEIAEDMEIDIPHIWQYLAELIVHMLHDGGIPMGDLFREVAKPLITIGKAGLLLSDLLSLLCKGMSRRKAGSLWREGGLSWKEFLPEEKDIDQFVTEKKVEFTVGNESGPEETSSKTEISFDDMCDQFDKLIKEKADNQRIFDWIEANLDEKQMISPLFIRALMQSICHSAVVFENPVRVDSEVVQNRVKVLTKYLNSDPQRELQALYALQALMAKLEQPPNLLRTFFDVLYDEDVISEEAFYKWESSKDPAEQQGKGVALKSVTAFFTWLREAEEESEGN
ncbi:eukaryotic translation initiation factor 4 gamma 1a isoform X3 [Scyliorhinus canicula]|uniref:eukaryotic translation initiation factor 4 gamma 1a isoform X3 n=1 Tax=Scyliorhinus canicula TaxID=7830 RepID=UPI0018F79970|nr:eukaryotic translation initiation factor 4 gamma 1a isoform X3 [Scyliorhinus canicula]